MCLITDCFRQERKLRFYSIPPLYVLTGMKHFDSDIKNNLAAPWKGDSQRKAFCPVKNGGRKTVGLATARYSSFGGIIMIAAGIAVLAGIGAGLGIGIATSKATEAIARQPEAAGDINKALLLGSALAEATAIYGFVIALLLVLMG